MNNDTQTLPGKKIATGGRYKVVEMPDGSFDLKRWSKKDGWEIETVYKTRNEATWALQVVVGYDQRMGIKW